MGLVCQQLICQLITRESSSTLYLKTHPGTVRVVIDLHFIIFNQLNVDFIHVVFFNSKIDQWLEPIKTMI